MKYKSSFSSLLPGLPLLPICALTDGWATKTAENQNKRGGCWDLGGGVGGTPVQFYQARLWAWVSEGIEGLLVCFTIIIF